ncbi:MAG TPA: hypothetical protein DDW65_19715 [Firmicutes bacterium]|jgi:N-acetylmuramoyl-L-alanine amidase|nr:hypothetical protein [Bacillota bacterium]
MFFKNPAIFKKISTLKLTYLFGGVLIIISAIGGIVFLGNEHHQPGLSHKKAEQVNRPEAAVKINNPLVSKNVNRPNLSNNLGNRSRPIPAKSISEAELPMLARIIHAEAGGESLKGQVAVGAVLLNRIKSGHFPRTLKANIFRPGEFESVSNGYIWSGSPTDASYRAARLALNGWDPTYGSLYFFNPAKTRSRWIWSRPITVIIGKHNFAG